MKVRQWRVHALIPAIRPQAVAGRSCDAVEMEHGSTCSACTDTALGGLDSAWTAFSLESVPHAAVGNGILLMVASHPMVGRKSQAMLLNK